MQWFSSFITVCWNVFLCYVSLFNFPCNPDIKMIPEISIILILLGLFPSSFFKIANILQATYYSKLFLYKFVWIYKFLFFINEELSLISVSYMCTMCPEAMVLDTWNSQLSKAPVLRWKAKSWIGHEVNPHYVQGNMHTLMRTSRPTTAYWYILHEALPSSKGSRQNWGKTKSSIFHLFLSTKSLFW